MNIIMSLVKWYL